MHLHAFVILILSSAASLAFSTESNIVETRPDSRHPLSYDIPYLNTQNVSSETIRLRAASINAENSTQQPSVERRVDRVDSSQHNLSNRGPRTFLSGLKALSFFSLPTFRKKARPAKKSNRKKKKRKNKNKKGKKRRAAHKKAKRPSRERRRKTKTTKQKRGKQPGKGAAKKRFGHSSPLVKHFGKNPTLVLGKGPGVVVASDGAHTCKAVSKPCGTTCSNDVSSIGKCALPAKFCTRLKEKRFPCRNEHVKMCSTTEKVKGVCKKIRRTGKCTDGRRTKVVCTYRTRPVGNCRPRTLAQKCKALRRKKCKYVTEKKVKPCAKIRQPCSDCVKKYALKMCTKTATRRVAVPCTSPGAEISRQPVASALPNVVFGKSNSSTSQAPSTSGAKPTAPLTTTQARSFPTAVPSPSASPSKQATHVTFEPFLSYTKGGGSSVSTRPSPTPIAFGRGRLQTRNVQCFASFFEEGDCEGASAVCQLFDPNFDSEACTKEVCRECKQIRGKIVSNALRRYCRDLVKSTCFLLTSFREAASDGDSSIAALHEEVKLTSRVQEEGLTTTVRSNEKKCYKTLSREVSVPCNTKLPRNEMCVKGCRVRKCTETKKKLITKRCKEHLPKVCRGRKPTCGKYKKKVCKRVPVTSGSDGCDEIVEYPCYKAKQVLRPCKHQRGAASNLFSHVVAGKLCSKVVPEKYFCGRTGAGRWGACTGARGEKRCKTKYCVTKTCT